MSDVQVRARARLTGWGAYAAVLLLASTVVHAGTYLGHTLSPNAPFFFGLHLGIFPVFVALVLQSRNWQRERSGPFGLRYPQLDWREWRPFLPTWAPRLVAILWAYAIANVLFALIHLPSRAATAELAEVQTMYMARMFSGHWMVFYALPLLFFTYVPQNSASDNPRPDGAA
jgi:hypothetical protein